MNLSNVYQTRSPRAFVSSLTTGLARPLLACYGNRRNLMRVSSHQGQVKLANCRAKLERGEAIYVLGLGCAGHNAGAGLVKATSAGIEVIANHEEERFRGIKHCQSFPHHSVATAILDLEQRGLGLDDLDAVVATWDYVELGARMVGHLAAELPGSLTLLRQQASPTLSFSDFRSAFDAPFKLATHSESEHSIPIIALGHHDNHAYFSLGVSPFADSSENTLVAVIDGLGDDGPISLYRCQGGKLTRFYKADRLFDSIGQMYLHLSSTQGGWPALSSEGRYMGAAAWGNTNRLTNPYYRPLRALFHFGPEGKLRLNGELANWHRGGSIRPYRKKLVEILGPPVLPDQMWNPDQVLRVEDIEHAPITRERVDKAAATQMLFEDAVFHVFDYGLRCTGASQAVFTGGAALNCVASARLLEHFDESWYEHYLNRQQTRLHLWVPPTPGDAGAPMGAAFHFACLAGAKPKARHAVHFNPFLCGHGPTRADIEQAVAEDPEIGSVCVGSSDAAAQVQKLADLMAWIVAQDGVIGIVQGPAETGPRALGHRSILANPTNPNTLDVLNARVKFREPIRPLAPMATLEAAKHFFTLADGGSDSAFDAYNYMVLTANATPAARKQIPAVVHHDGSSRVQIVRREIDPLMHFYLRALGRHLGVEVSVNTSLNVGSPIVQTPQQALQALKRAKGLHGIFLVADDGSCQIAWHNVTDGVKDGGRQIQTWIRQWQHNQTTPDPRTVSPPTEIPSYSDRDIVLRRTVLRQPTLRSRCEPLSSDQADAKLRC